MLRILDERRTDLVKQNGRLVNQLHAVLRELFPGGIERNFATEDAATQFKGLRPETSADAMRTRIALEIVGDLRRIRFQIDDLTTRIKTERAACGTQLPKIPGVGTVTAARILARTGQPHPIRQRGRLRQLHRDCARRGRQRRQATPSALAQRRPLPERRHPHRGRHPGPNTQQRRKHLPPAENGRRKDDS